MKRTVSTALLSAALAFGGAAFVAGVPAYAAAPAAAAGGNVDELIKQLQGEGTLAAKAPAELEAAYTAVLPKLTENPTGDDLPLQKIAFRASRPGAEAERTAFCKVLASKLTPDAKPELKVMLLRHLQRVGREESVPAVVALLSDGDANVRECARRALSANPSKAASDALHVAFDKATDGKWKAALVTALEYRRDPAEAVFFARLVQGDDDAVRIPAALALARTGDGSAAQVLAAARTKGSDAAKAAVTDAYLLLADRMAPANKEAAASIYREFVTGPNPFRYAAIIGLGKVAAPGDVAKIVDLLGDKDVAARGAALEVLRSVKDPAVAAAVQDKYKAADAAAKPWLLRALVAQQGKAALPAVAAAASDANEATRIEAFKALAVIGDGSVLPALLKGAAAKGDEQSAARNALELIPGADLDTALVGLIDKGTPQERAEIIRALGARSVKDAVPALLAATSDKEGAVRGEAHRALALIADYSAAPKLIDLVVAAKEDGDRDAVGRTLAAVIKKNDDAEARVAPVLAAADKAEGATKAALLNVLAQCGGNKALEACKAAIKSADEKTHEAGLRALANWPDAAPMKELLEIAKSEPKENLAILSLRGYIRMVGLQSKERKPAAEVIKAYQAALPLAKRPDERKQILGGLGDVKDVKALAAIAPMLDDEKTAQEASAAALKVAKDQWEKNPMLAQDTLTKVVAVVKNEKSKKEAQELLDKAAAKAKGKK